jgi:hypothetical protein
MNTENWKTEKLKIGKLKNEIKNKKTKLKHVTTTPSFQNTQQLS